MAIRLPGNVGAPQHLEAPSGLSVSAYSVLAWVYQATPPSVGNYRDFFSRTNNSGGPGLSVFNTGSILRLNLGDLSGDHPGTTALSVARWYHLAWTLSGAQHLVYLNGELEVSASTLQSPQNALWLGQYYGLASSNNFDGRFASLKLYSRELTQEAIRAEMRSTWVKSRAGLWGSYPMLPGAPERIRDYSGNGRSLVEVGTFTDEPGPSDLRTAMVPVSADVARLYGEAEAPQSEPVELTVPIQQLDDTQATEDGGTLYNGFFIGRFQTGTSGDDWQGLRFVGLDIPQGATIQSAVVTVTSGGITAGADPTRVHTKIRAAALDDCPAWSQSTNNPRFVARTTAGVDYDPATWPDSGPVSMPDISSVIQEVVNRAGWESGNAIGVLIDPDGNEDFCELSGFDNSASITVVYTVGVEEPAAGEVVTLGRMAGGAQLYAPWLVRAPHPITLPALASSAQLFAPSVACAPHPVTLPLLATDAQLFAPALIAAAHAIALPLLGAGAHLLPPTVARTPHAITLPALAGAAQLYAPVLARAAHPVTLPLLTGAVRLFAPAVVAGTAGTVVVLPALAGGAQLYAPALRRAPHLVVLPALADGTRLYAPALVRAPRSITLPPLGGGAQLFAPAVVPGLPPTLVVLPRLGAATQLFAPAVVQAPHPITVPRLVGAARLYAPAVMRAPHPILLTRMAGGAVLRAPSIGLAIPPGLLTIDSLAFAPTLTFDAVELRPALELASLILIPDPRCN